MGGPTRWSTCWSSFASRSFPGAPTRGSCHAPCLRRSPRSTSRWSRTSPRRSTTSNSSATNWARSRKRWATSTGSASATSTTRGWHPGARAASCARLSPPYEQVGRELGGIREETVAARAAELEAGEGLEAIGDELTDVTAAREELAGRPELASLEHAQRHADSSAETAGREAEKEKKVQRNVRARVASHDSALRAAVTTRGLVANAATAAERTASASR